VDQAELLSALIGEIYDAALDPSLWTDVVGKAGRFVGGLGATLFSKDAVSKSGNVYCESDGIPDTFWQLYFDKYVKFDPATTGQFFSELDQPVATANLLPCGEFLETRLHKEWAHPQGSVDLVTALLDKSSTSAAFFGVFRHERDGVADDETRRRMQLIVPHIRRAVLVGRLIDRRQAEAATLADTLDGLSAGMCLVDAEGRIVHANAACQLIFGARDFLSVNGGRLVASDAEADQTLRELFAAAGGGDTAIGIRGIALTLTTSDGESYVARVLPLTSGARRRAGIGTTAVAALFVHKASLAIPSSPEIIARHFKLTPAELRVLLATVEVGGVPEIAEALGIADTTVRTHLGNLFEKTGTGRQADLVKIVAGFSTPLLG
jgi:DNA-binding CsgD family transcriptional regulator